MRVARGPRPEWVRRLVFTVEDAVPDAVLRWEARRGRELPEWVWAVPSALGDGVRVVWCLVLGHEPVADQCGQPGHDFCVWCGKPAPGLADRGLG